MNEVENTKEISLRTEYIRLDNLLKYAGVCMTGGEAKLLIESGTVLVNGQPCAMRGKKLRPGDRVQAGNQSLTVVDHDPLSD